MKVTTIRTTWAERELQQNTHIITIGDKCIIIDPAARLQDIMQVIEGRSVEAILVTHAHFDHISNMDAYEIAFGCPIYMHKNSEKFLHDSELNVSKYFVHEIIFDAENIHYLKGNEILNIAGIEVNAIHTPGHSEDSMCYLCFDKNVSIDSEELTYKINKREDITDIEQQKVLFTGDTCFARAVGRTDLATGNPKRLIVSLNQLLKLDFVSAYTGHMRTTTKEEQQSNIPLWIKTLKKSILNIDKDKEDE